MELTLAKAWYGLLANVPRTSAHVTGVASIGRMNTGVSLPGADVAYAVRYFVNAGASNALDVVDAERGEDAGFRQRHSTVIFSDATNTSGIPGAAITTAGNLSVTVTAAALPGGSKVYSVPVALNDSVTSVHTKIQASWNADPALTTFYDVGASSLSIQLTNKAVAGLFPAPDSTLNIAVQPGTAAGIIEDLNSLPISAGRAGTPAGSLLDHEGNAIPSLASVHGILIEVASGTGTITGTAADSIAYADGQVVTLIRPDGIATDFADTLTITAATATDITISVIGTAA
jgi:hypothetical protein